MLPYWDDPQYAAYIVVWSRFYSSREENRADVEVPWEDLPDPLKRRAAVHSDVID